MQQLWQKKTLTVLIFLGFASLILLQGCATIHNVDVELEESKSAPKITSYSKALSDLGTMTEVFGTPQLKIQSKEITDKTGASGSTGAEIQANISEIVKSSLNSVGGNTVYIDYDPEFMNNMKILGYSEFGNKLIPDVVLSGAITEFDRGLLTREKGSDGGAEFDVKGMPSWLPSQSVGADFENSSITSKSRITLDFNLKNFQTLSGIAKRSIVNSMEVSKGVAKRELGVTIFGVTFGAKGSVKKVQGRHEAVRLLVELSMIQMVGRHLDLPYWRLLGDDAAVDEVVMTEITKEFRSWDEAGKIVNTQVYLYLHGYDVDLSGQLDDKTNAAIQSMSSKSNINNLEDVYKQLFLTMPIDEDAVNRRNALYKFLAGNEKSLTQLQTESSPSPAFQPQLDTHQPDLAIKTTIRVNDDSKKNAIHAFNSFRQGNYQQAALLFQETLNTNHSPPIYYYLSLCYQQQNDLKKAMNTLEDGTQAFPADFNLWKSLGLIYSEIGKVGNSKNAFKHALALKPKDRQVKFFLEQIDVKK